MAKLTLKCSAEGTHEAYDGDRKVGEIENDHLYDYATKHVGKEGASVQGNLSARGAASRLNATPMRRSPGKSARKAGAKKKFAAWSPWRSIPSRPKSPCCRKPSAQTASSTTAGWMRWTIPAKSAAPPGAAPRTPNSACRMPSTAAKSPPP